MTRGTLPDPVEPMLHTLGNRQTVIRYKGPDKRGRIGVRNLPLGTVTEEEAAHRLKVFKREHKAMQENTGKKNGHANKKDKGPERAEAVPGRALTVVAEESTDAHASYNREHYRRRKLQAEAGVQLAQGLRRIKEHHGVLAANLEVAARTLKMVETMIRDLEEEIGAALE